MEQLILIIHVLAALGIVALILLQQGKGAEMGASFGAGASQTLFGSSGGGNMLTKTTAIFATVFFATSFGLAIIAKEKAQLSGQLDINLPAAVESKVVPQAPGSDVPDVDGADEAGAAATENSDVPELDNQAESATVAPENVDVPEVESAADSAENSAAQ